MKKSIITILTMIALHTLHAVPSLINYQGRLTDPNGNVLTGNKIMSVSIYDAATEGTSLYTEEVGSISLDSNGIYSFSFGTNQTALTSALQTAGEHWLELTVDGTSQTPRERILSVPFAQVAGSAPVNFKGSSFSEVYKLREPGIIYYAENTGIIFAHKGWTESGVSISVFIGETQDNLNLVCKEYWNRSTPGNSKSVTVPVAQGFYYKIEGISNSPDDASWPSRLYFIEF